MSGIASEKDHWPIYGEMTGAAPDDASVVGHCLGLNWSCAVVECGAGVSCACKGESPHRRMFSFDAPSGR